MKLNHKIDYKLSYTSKFNSATIQITASNVKLHFDNEDKADCYQLGAFSLSV